MPAINMAEHKNRMEGGDKMKIKCKKIVLSDYFNRLIVKEIDIKDEL